MNRSLAMINAKTRRTAAISRILTDLQSAIDHTDSDEKELAASRERRREAAARLRVHHLANLAACFAR